MRARSGCVRRAAVTLTHSETGSPTTTMTFTDFVRVSVIPFIPFIRLRSSSPKNRVFA